MSELSRGLALVTGAASGIGQATAWALAERGASLALVDLDRDGLDHTAELARRLGGRVVLEERIDVGDREAMRALADRVHAELGPLDILVNNAGVATAGLFVDTELEAWDRVVSVNLMGVVHGCRFFVPAMRERGAGHVVSLASLAGLVPPPGLSAYAATKSAVVGLTRVLAAELHPHGVRATAICPGLVHTPIPRRTRWSGAMFGEDGAPRLTRTFRRRGVSPEHVADVILRAVDDRAGPIVPVGADARLFSRLARLFPGLTERGARMSPERLERLFVP